MCSSVGASLGVPPAHVPPTHTTANRHFDVHQLLYWLSTCCTISTDRGRIPKIAVRAIWQCIYRELHQKKGHRVIHTNICTTALLAIPQSLSCRAVRSRSSPISLPFAIRTRKMQQLRHVGLRSRCCSGPLPMHCGDIGQPF